MRTAAATGMSVLLLAAPCHGAARALLEEMAADPSLPQARGDEIQVRLMTDASFPVAAERLGELSRRQSANVAAAIPERQKADLARAKAMLVDPATDAPSGLGKLNEALELVQSSISRDGDSVPALRLLVEIHSWRVESLPPDQRAEGWNQYREAAKLLANRSGLEDDELTALLLVEPEPSRASAVRSFLEHHPVHRGAMETLAQALIGGEYFERVKTSGPEVLSLVQRLARLWSDAEFVAGAGRLLGYLEESGCGISQGLSEAKVQLGPAGEIGPQSLDAIAQMTDEQAKKIADAFRAAFASATCGAEGAAKDAGREKMRP